MTDELKPRQKVWALGDERYLVSSCYRDSIPYTEMAARIPNQRAGFALGMLERWAMVAGEPRGEDGAGRSKVEMLEVEHMVKRAFDTAEQAFAEIEKRGWMLECPHPHDIIDASRESN